jgi:hypothetical protein
MHAGLLGHYIGSIRANSFSEGGKNLTEARRGFCRRTIDQARRTLGDDVLECRSLPQRKGASTKLQSETHEDHVSEVR